MGEEGEEEEYSDLLSPDDSILILTGANASGKSVFLKTVAIIVYMVRLSPAFLLFLLGIYADQMIFVLGSHRMLRPRWRSHHWPY
jgi:AAA15 family ATPase/GTPase